MTLTTRYRRQLAVAWLALHTWGLACWALPWDIWRWYYVAVAALEFAGLIAARLGHGPWGMWSPHVWALTHDPLAGRIVGWRGFFAAAWTLYFGGAFAAVQPWTGTGADVLIAIGFMVWLWAHFLHARRSERRPHG